jgi:Spy/CpxP family protein refolding chaperone
MRVFFKGAAAVAVAALFPIVGAAQQGQAQAPQGPPPPGGGRGMARGEVRQVQPLRQRGPQLTNEQREQLRTFEEQQRAAGETARRELGDLHRQLNETLSAAQIDNGKVTQLRSAIVQRETALAQQRVDRLAKIASVLTAEQRQSLGGRGIGSAFGPGGPGGPGGGGRVMIGPGGERRMIQGRPGAGAMGRGMGPGQRRGAAPQMRGRMQQRQPLRGGGRGAAGAGPVLRERLDDARLRAEVRRLEAQLEALRRRIGR